MRLTGALLTAAFLLIATMAYAEEIAVWEVVINDKVVVFDFEDLTFDQCLQIKDDLQPKLTVSTVECRPTIVIRQRG